ncbi:Ribosomal protein S27/S33, mitochondrial [Phaffia rhodozyma]|uniref:Small ribosomal subunit protein mS33 n=1 Tax=Phaffia rhodozyma TaxID=264483 RepID=A0A0F7SVM5_PHARH|nr:Ribosomal protein S27/S33, mitochondrial [Phaffia rhodozyma]
MSVRPPTLTRLADLARLKSTVLQTPYNPLNLRTGLHYLTQPLRGPETSSWYPIRMTDKMTRGILDLPKTWHNERHQLWEQIKAARAARGKLATRKGHGKKAALRAKRG